MQVASSALCDGNQRISKSAHLYCLKAYKNNFNSSNLRILTFSADDDVDIDPLANTHTEEMDAELPNKATKKGKKGKKGHKDDELYVYSSSLYLFLGATDVVCTFSVNSQSVCKH